MKGWRATMENKFLSAFNEQTAPLIRRNQFHRGPWNLINTNQVNGRWVHAPCTKASVSALCLSLGRWPWPTTRVWLFASRRAFYNSGAAAAACCLHISTAPRAVTLSPPNWLSAASISRQECSFALFRVRACLCHTQKWEEPTLVAKHLSHAHAFSSDTTLDSETVFWVIYFWLLLWNIWSRMRRGQEVFI